MESGKIYTTYFANIKNLPASVVPVSIAGNAPDKWNGLEYKALAPRWEFFKVWRITHDNEYYIKKYYNFVLCKLDPFEVVKDILRLTDLRDFALVCYEKEGFCHRHIVREWLRDFGGFNVEEFGG